MGSVITSYSIHYTNLYDQGQDVPNDIGAEDPLARRRADAVIGECRRHHRHVAGIDEHRALPEVEIEHLFRVTLYHARVEHHVGDGAVAVTSVTLALVDLGA